MELQIDQTVFAEELAWVARALPAKTSTPALNGILITAADRTIRCTGSNGDSTNSAEIGAEVSAGGDVVVPGRLLADVIKSLPKKKITVTVDPAASRMLLVCGRARFKLPLFPVALYPQPPAQPEAIGTVPADLFASAVAQVVFACARDNTLPVLTTISATFDVAGSMMLAATDRYRLAVKELPWEPLLPATVTVLLQGRMLMDILRHPYPGVMTVSLDGNGSLFGVAAGNRRSLMPVYDGVFPDYRRLIPSTRLSVAEVDVAEFVEAARRIRLVADRPTVPLRAMFDTEEVSLVAGGAGTDPGAAEVVPCSVEDGPVQTAFNTEYLLDALGALDGEVVRLEFAEPHRPVLMTSSGDPTYRHVLMPMKASPV